MANNQENSDNQCTVIVTQAMIDAGDAAFDAALDARLEVESRAERDKLPSPIAEAFKAMLRVSTAQASAEPSVPITAEMVSALRDKTNCALRMCRRALVTANGDMIKAEELLRANSHRFFQVLL